MDSVFSHWPSDSELLDLLYFIPLELRGCSFVDALFELPFGYNSYKVLYDS